MGRQQTTFQQDLPGDRRAGNAQQAGQFAGVHGEPELVDRRTQAGGFAAKAQVAGAGNLQAATDTGAANRCDGRVPAGLHGRQRPADGLVVGDRLVGIGALHAELVEIAAGGESGAFAAHDDGAQVVVGIEFRHDQGETPPHGGIDGVEFAGIEKRDGGQATVTFEQDVAGQAYLVRRVTPISFRMYFS